MLWTCHKYMVSCTDNYPSHFDLLCTWSFGPSSYSWVWLKRPCSLIREVRDMRWVSDIFRFTWRVLCLSIHLTESRIQICISFSHSDWHCSIKIGLVLRCAGSETVKRRSIDCIQGFLPRFERLPSWHLFEAYAVFMLLEHL